jgi:hypothetical protein
MSQSSNNNKSKNLNQNTEFEENNISYNEFEESNNLKPKEFRNGSHIFSLFEKKLNNFKKQEIRRKKIFKIIFIISVFLILVAFITQFSFTKSNKDSEYLNRNYNFYNPKINSPPNIIQSNQNFQDFQFTD